jgi:hypothetical protein
MIRNPIDEIFTGLMIGPCDIRHGSRDTTSDTKRGLWKPLAAISGQAGSLFRWAGLNRKKMLGYPPTG